MFIDEILFHPETQDPRPKTLIHIRETLKNIDEALDDKRKRCDLPCKVPR